jgi:transcriptional regulator with GAF, ATPase, and Fis domain
MMGTELIGVSQNIKNIKKMINKVAGTGFSILVCGETGVGKEVVVRQLHQKSDKSEKPFVKVNCAALPDTLAESELFGYEQGAFTGASRRMRGKFEQTKGGVLFLDEIGDMPIVLQSKLLHALQDGEFIPLGSEKTVESNAWVIAATNHDLKEDLKDGKFRQDLYFRINTVTIKIDPLRKRPEDIPHLIEYYIQKYGLQLKGTSPLFLKKSIMDKLIAYHWPGNVRELQNVIRRIIVLGQSEENIKELICNTDKSRFTSQPLSDQNINFSNLKDILDLTSNSLDLSSLSLKKIRKKAENYVEKEVITHALNKTGWNRKKAAKILNVSYRTIFIKLHELDIATPSYLL